MSLDNLYLEIKQRFQLGPALHMTHIENLADILQFGGLRSYNAMRGTAYFNLANDDVQAGRGTKLIPCTNLALHDYVPLYFGIKTPMVACNQGHNENIVFLRLSLNVLRIKDVVFTDGNARSTLTRFFLFKTLDDLTVLDCGAINSTKYSGDDERKRRKQAEILVPGFLPMANVLDIVVFSTEARIRALAILRKFGSQLCVRTNPGFYFISRIVI